MNTHWFDMKRRDIEPAAEQVRKVRDAAVWMTESNEGVAWHGQDSPIGVTCDLANRFLRLQREIRTGEVVVLVKEGCGCLESFWSERAIEDAKRVLAEAAKQREEKR